MPDREFPRRVIDARNAVQMAADKLAARMREIQCTDPAVTLGCIANIMDAVARCQTDMAEATTDLSVAVNTEALNHAVERVGARS